jgi:acetoacetyl-CoA synthetase
MTAPSWSPSPERLAASNLTTFITYLEARGHGSFPDYRTLHEWSITDQGAFWSAVWSFCGVVGDPGDVPVADDGRMPGARFFPDAHLNFAENLLRRRDDSLAMIAAIEPGEERRLTTRELYDDVSRCVQALRSAGVNQGDRVAGFVANVPEAIIASLAAASLGAVWSSCSPDFGTEGVVDRFGQIEPTVLFAVAGHHYGGKHHDTRAKVSEIVARLPTLKKVVLIPDDWEDFLAPFSPDTIDFVRVPFAHPLYVL